MINKEQETGPHPNSEVKLRELRDEIPLWNLNKDTVQRGRVNTCNCV